MDFIVASGRLKRVARTGWAVRALPNESVADHSYRTAVLASVISTLVDVQVDRSKLLDMALIHDLGEAYIGDWDHEATSLVGRGTKKTLEDTVATKLFRGLPTKTSERFLTLWREYVSGETVESKIVHFADKLEAAIQALEYRRAGMDRRVYEMFVGNLRDLSLPTELDALLKAFLEVLGNE